MAVGNRRSYDDDNYILDDEIREAEGYEDDGYYEEERPTASQYIKSLFRKIRGADVNEDDYEDEYAEEEAEEAEENIRRRNKTKSKRSARREEAYEEKEADEDEYSKEDLNRFDEKYGTKGSSQRADFKRRARERMNPDGRTASKKQRTSSTSSSKWEGYRGNVKNILEAAPMNMDDIEEIARELMNDNAAIINLNGMRTYKTSAISFLDGVSFAIKYRFEEIGGGYYICAPIGFMVPFKFDNTHKVRR